VARPRNCPVNASQAESFRFASCTTFVLYNNNMPRRHVSPDLKERIPYLRYVEGFKVKEIERILGVKKSMIYQTLNYYRNYGVAFNPRAFSNFSRGRRRILTSTDLNLIKALLDQEPTMYLDELQDELLTRRGAVVSIPTLLRSLRRLHFSRKSVSVRALERNDLDRSIYMNQFAEMVSDPAMVMFVDEAAKNKKNPSRKIGWSLKGQRVVQRRCFIRGQRFSILPVLTLDGIIAHDIIPGSVTSELFVKFLREHVVCSTLLYCFLP
jgi:transposase